MRIRTDDGLVGTAPSRRGVILEDLVDRRLRAELVGADPLQREWLWHRVWELDRIEEFPIYVLGLVDIALWDLAGKAVGLPVYELLGGFRTEIPAYVSTATFSSVEEYLEVADQCVELGYGASQASCMGRCTARRVPAGAGATLCGRPDGPYVRRLGRVRPHRRCLPGACACSSKAGYFWYEEPMREFNVTAYKWLAERIRVPLLVAETSDGAHMNTADFIASGCATFVRTSTGLKAGFTGAMRIALTPWTRSA